MSNSNIDEILFKIRTTHEVEHNDNQWTTEFVYTLEEAKQAIQQELLKARIDEISILRNGYGWGDALETSEYILDDRLDDLQAKLKGDDK